MSYRLIFSLFFILITFHLQAQKYLCQVEVSDRWGYMNETGELVIKPIYYKSEPFSNDGFALVLKNETMQWQIINSAGETIKTEIPTWSTKGTKFIEGMLPVKVNGKWGYMNTSGKLVIPAIYNDATNWGSGFGIVRKSKGEFYVVDKNGNLKSVNSDIIFKVEQFSEGRAAFQSKFSKEGFIDTNGEIAIKPNHVSVGRFNNGVAWAKNEFGLVIYIDKNGIIAIKGMFEVCKDFDPIAKAALVKESGTWKYLLENGTRVELKMDTYGDFSDGLAYCRQGDYVGFIMPNGEWAITPQFRAVRNFKNNYAAASGVNLWGIIDKSGKWVIPPKFKAIKDFEKIEN